jgi:glycogen synthase
MRAAIFSWEYPPRIIGKLADYVSALAAELVTHKVDVNVVTFHDTLAGVSKESTGVKVIRVANPVRTHVSLLTWLLTLNQEVERAAADLCYPLGKGINIIDVHDWHFIPAAVTIKNALGVPFVFTVDSIEEHRSPGSYAPMNLAIRGIEWLGFYQAQRVIVKTDWMRSEIVRVFQTPQEKISVVSPTSPTWASETLDTYVTALGEVPV